MGLGLRFMPRAGALAELYWGGRLLSQPNPHEVAQDYGLYFRIKLDAPAIF